MAEHMQTHQVHCSWVPHYEVTSYHAPPGLLCGRRCPGILYVHAHCVTVVESKLFKCCGRVKWVHQQSVILTRGQFWPSGIVVACVCLCVRLSVRVCGNHLLVRAITRDPFKLWSPNLDQRCKRPCLGPYCFGGQLTLTFKVKFNLKVRIYPIWACPHHNSLPIGARITQFGPDVKNCLVKISFVLGGNWPWPSGSTLT